eukprot:31175-Pelagococcus_subviridis.AAC.17
MSKHSRSCARSCPTRNAWSCGVTSPPPPPPRINANTRARTSSNDGAPRKLSSVTPERGAALVHDADARAHGAAAVDVVADHLAVDGDRAAASSRRRRRDVERAPVALAARGRGRRVGVGFVGRRGGRRGDEHAPRAPAARFERGFTSRRARPRGQAQVLAQRVDAREVLPALAASRVVARVPRIALVLAQELDGLVSLVTVRARDDSRAVRRRVEIRTPRARGVLPGLVARGRDARDGVDAVPRAERRGLARSRASFPRGHRRGAREVVCASARPRPDT